MYIDSAKTVGHQKSRLGAAGGSCFIYFLSLVSEMIAKLYARSAGKSSKKTHF
jgi:hypothetical protein